MATTMIISYFSSSAFHGVCALACGEDEVGGDEKKFFVTPELFC
jgi:hypothetical protein